MDYDFKNFGELLYDKNKMKATLPSPIYKRFIDAVNHEVPLDLAIADVIAHNMKMWALSHGCTHYTHWFHPLSGTTAEKHNSFIENIDGQPIARFSGKSLIKDEPDASSFPNGGLRATFEARGYTYWDVESPAFIRGHVLYIPTVFISYTGEALDTKGPLLKSIDAINKSAVKLLNLLGKKVKTVKPYIGLEQEYFLVDKDDFLKRRDLYLTGKTLLGLVPPKAQQLETHYFGPIPQRVNKFMEELNKELWDLGIYAKAEHNEVAPGQFELAPIFSNVNIAVDQNMLTMEILQDVALKNNMVCLLHEKPYQGVNGSGKHNNYSLLTDTGLNLFDPKCENETLFLIFVSCLMKGVDEYSDLIRLSSSNPGNDFRLGASEAPPAIISMYIAEEFENKFEKKSISKKNKKFKMDTISSLPSDESDRNRTSPVAFTGNKFEFRSLGSSMNASELNIVINLVMSKAVDEFYNELNLYNGDDIESKAREMALKLYNDHKRILFSGNGYSDEWVEEAKNRGLHNIHTFAEAINSLNDEKNINLFDSYQVLNPKEVNARKEIKYENYYNIRLIEIKTLTEMTYQQVIPSAIKELNFICACGKEFMSKSMLTKVDKLQLFIDESSLLAGQIEDKVKELSYQNDYQEKCMFILNNILPLCSKLRTITDNLEKYISKDNQPFPQYEQLFFDIDF